MKLEMLYQHDVVREIDLAFGRMIRRLEPGADPAVGVAAALVSKASAGGDVCLDLGELSRSGIQPPDATAPVAMDIDPARMRMALNRSRLVGAPGDAAPLILDGDRLYLQRYWAYERLVADSILARCDAAAQADPAASAIHDIIQAFSGADPRQQQAMRTAAERRFMVISGGPGTGKTYTIAAIITLLWATAGTRRPRIRLAAPTGKAAARLQEALEASLSILSAGAGADAPDSTDLQAQTLHRLLGAVAGKSTFRFHAENPLPADAVIVDEASMVDMALMAKLIQAVPPDARLILVGDKDQLASVEAGAVLGDICSGLRPEKGAVPHTGAKDSAATAKIEKREDSSTPIVVLQTNYRFEAESGIHRLGLAVNRGDGDAALALLEKGRQPDLTYLPMQPGFDLDQALDGVVADAFGPIFSAADPQAALRHLMGYKILTPVRKGAFGVEGLNASVERLLKNRGLIQPPGGASPWYAGRPVMITRNDYYHNLYNGDIGITTVETIGNAHRIRIAFPGDAASGGQQDLVYLAPEQLPEHETVFAMTVHKSQGTEFDQVLLILPDRDAPVLTRELVYTAITRARRQVNIWGLRQIFQTAVTRRIRRASGLRSALQSRSSTGIPDATQ